MHKTSQIYQNIVQQLIEKHGTQAVIGIQDDIATLTKNVEKMIMAVDKNNEDSWDDLDSKLQNLIYEDYEKIQNDTLLNYALKFIDFQHFYVAFKQLEEKYNDENLKAVFFFSRGVLDDCSNEMVEKLQYFRL